MDLRGPLSGKKVQNGKREKAGKRGKGKEGKKENKTPFLPK